ncbi:PR domain zinc finger protein 15-like [Hydractinia symbiolongicarpus]|uniref:PR domain zinc finger protein 15-like n=1 Tax=Hydractinia symbiolongicarpus TaxID=13093 RepID=UPI002549EFBD|nr:PR domain zinc finger protein 15-like [Hydractinia symbiolongicarpus]
MDVASKHRMAGVEMRSHHELRRPPAAGWMLVEGGRPPHPHPPPWTMHGVAPPPQENGLLKQVGQNPAHAAPYSAKYHPYGMRQQYRPHQFTVHELEKCLYGKLEMRVVQIGDRKSTPPSKPSSTSSGLTSEDKNKPAKWCDMCQEIRFGECPQHDGPLPSLPSLTLSGPKSYAVSTFPDEVGLCISTLPLAGYGVFAKQFIPMGTWIGPYEGKKIAVEDGLKQISQGDAPFLWEIYENLRLSHFLDASDENASSWMRFIQCARHRGEQNLFVFQYYGSIYYRAFKDIAIGSELLVWYDDKYPQYFGMPYDIRDMSSFSMESIQAPTEVPKKSDLDPNRIHHGERSHPFLHGGKVIPNAAPVGRERNEPPRIPPNGHLHTQPLHGHPSNTFQPPSAQPPAQPPTLSQAPSIIDTRSVHSITHVSVSRPHVHPNAPPSHSPRKRNPGFRREPNHASSSMLRSMSADDLRKRNSAGDRPPSEREHLEHLEHMAHAERGNRPSPGLLGSHMNLPPGAIPHHYPSSITYSKLPPPVMSVTPVTHERSRIKLDDITKHNEMKLYHEHAFEHERLAREKDRVLHERERMARQHERIERMNMERGRSSHERAMHEGNAPSEPWEIYRCQGCRQSFSQKAALETHHCVAEAAKPYQCGRCQLSFPEPVDLQEHMAMHTSERPFKCGVCARSFSGTNALSAHMRSHTLNEPKLPVKDIMKTAPLDCQKCGKRFLQAADMTKHLSTPGQCVS